MATKTPLSPKVAAGGAAGILLVLAANAVELATGYDLPDDVVSAAAVLASFAAGYLTPDRLRTLGAVAERAGAVLGRGDGEHRA